MNLHDNFSDILNYVVAAVAGWVAYIHKELGSRPTKEELLLRLDLIKQDIAEIKEDVKELKHK